MSACHHADSGAVAGEEPQRGRTFPNRRGGAGGSPVAAAWPCSRAVLNPVALSVVGGFEGYERDGRRRAADMTGELPHLLPGEWARRCYETDVCASRCRLA